MTTATTTTVELPPTATYVSRRATYAPAGPGEGTLTILLRKKSGPPEEAVYAVEEQAPPAPGVRSFFLEKLTLPESPDTYGVVVGPRGARCTCTAGCVRKYVCRHEAAVKELLSQDAIPPVGGRS